MSLEYYDFELRLSRERNQYIASLLTSPAGEVPNLPIELDIRRESYRRQLRSIEAAIHGFRNVTRGTISPERRLLEEFGYQLFSAVFSGEIKSRFDSSLAITRGEGKGLRIKLRLDSPELTAVPWEIAYDKREKHFVTLSAYSPIVRYIELQRRISDLTSSFPLQILVLSPEAHDQPPLKTDKEKANFEEAIRNLVRNYLVRVEYLNGYITLSRLQEALRKTKYNIIHFIGHGLYSSEQESGSLMFTTEDGTGQPVSGRHLGILLRDAPTVKLVFLNACEGARGSPRASFSSVASALVLAGMPAVIAMQFNITDSAAIQFASAFYLSLVDNYPVDASVAEGRKAIALGASYDTVEWVTPVLYMRAPNGIIFELPPSEFAHAQRQQALSKEEEQLASLYDQGMKYLDHEQFHQSLIIFEQIRAISPTYKNININEIIAYLRAEIVGRQRSVTERYAQLPQQAHAKRLIDTWERAKSSVKSLLKSERPEGKTNAVLEKVNWDTAIERAVETIRSHVGQRLQVCSWEETRASRRMALTLEYNLRRFRAIIDADGNVLKLSEKKQGIFGWPTIPLPQDTLLHRRKFICTECGRLIEIILDQKGQAKIKCKKCGAYYVIIDNEFFRVDTRCPACGAVNIVRFDMVERKLPSQIECKQCGVTLEISES